MNSPAHRRHFHDIIHLLIAYLDNAATTCVDPAVAKTVQECLVKHYGNPASVHQFGIRAEQCVNTAKQQILAALGDPDGDLGAIYWTSGGTESDALAILGAAEARKRGTKTIVYSAIEHSAVSGAAIRLQARGWTAIQIPVCANGTLDVDQVMAVVTDQTSIVAVMLVNNEIGSILPVSALTREIRAQFPRVHIHCDAAQALGKIPIDIGTLGVDTLALSGHKLHGPKGIGALWLRNKARIQPLWTGGGQQNGIRAGTLNVPGIVGMGAAAELAVARMDTNQTQWKTYAATLLRAANQCGVAIRHNAETAPTSPHILSIAFHNIPAEPLLHALEHRGVMASAGSACGEKTRRASPVLAAIGLDPAYGTIRFSFGSHTTQPQVDHAASALIDAIASLT